MKLSGGQRQRLSLARAFLTEPKILFLEEGRLIGDGTHEELVAGCPEYAEAYHRWEVEEETSLV